MNINPRGALRPVRNDRESDPDQEEDSLLLIAYASNSYSSNEPLMHARFLRA